SQVINEHYGTSFSNVLSGMRIREACRRMSEESSRYRHVTIEAIALSVGFKSRTAFINAFKREVGLTPSEYLKMALP
ncbi:MAG: AraC family transcriptional regulator, partial [Desulfovibrio sp.]|nr:AraC family transcriptional regulator [Desulfovibrio sp.]